MPTRTLASTLDAPPQRPPMGSAKTPLRQDTRLWTTIYVLTAVLALVAVGRPPDGGVLAFLGGALAWFTGQSQAGQTIRAKAQIQAQDTKEPLS